MEKKSMNDKQKNAPEQSAETQDTASQDTATPEVNTKPESTKTDSKHSADASATIATQPEPDPDLAVPTEAPAEKKTKQRVSKLAILALLLAIIALIIIGYGYTLLQKMHIQQTEQVSALQSQLGSSDDANRQLQQQNGQILGELNQVRTDAGQQKSNVDELQTRLSKAMQQVSKLGTDTRKDWLLAEVEYLLRLANQRTLMEQTASGALSLLQGADQILKETDDVSIYPVRKALAQDIVALEAVPTVDIDGIFLKLTAINAQVDKLRLLPVTDKHQLPDMLQQITPDTLSQVGESWAAAMDKLGSLVVIRDRDAPVTPLLSPEQHYFLTQNLHLMLEQTQLALLQGKQDAYNAGLNKSIEWIKTYFHASDATTQSLIRSLGELQANKIAPELPDISGSLRQLKTYLAELHNLEGAAR